ncbi:MAG: hypothetical protein HDS44_03015 [Bacteroides sp.]|nr:hypothetical protein [Bacteroides sp.]
MKKLLLHFLPFCLLLSCNTLRRTSHYQKDPPLYDSIADSTLAEIKKAKRIHFYKLNPSDMNTDVRICGYAVSEDFGNLGKRYAEQIYTLLSDTALLDKEYIPVKQPFYPTFAFKANTKSQLCCLLSFGTEEIAFSDNDSTYRTYRVNDMQTLRELCDEITNRNSLNQK